MEGKRAFAALASALLLLLITASSVAAEARATSASSGINPKDFVRDITNPYFPLKPGTTFYYKGTKDGAPTSDKMYVTHKTKVIQGVVCIVVHDQAFEEGVLVEDTIDWFAQDTDGNVWYFGESTRELDAHGKVISTEGSWQAGVNGAKPGIIMEAHPRVGDRYQQELLPGVAEDKAQVLRLEDNRLCVRYGCFDDLLQTKEWTPLEPQVAEHKYYAKGLGFVASVMVKGGHERTELVRVVGP